MKVGDKLWYVPSYRKGGGCYVTIQKVGRIWVTLSDHPRADKRTLRTEGGSLYQDKAAHDSKIALAAALSVFKRKVSDLQVGGTDLECLASAAAALDAFHARATLAREA